MPELFEQLAQGGVLVRRWLPTIVLAVLAAWSTWLFQQVDSSTRVSTGTARHDPDFFMEDFHSTTMDESGHPDRTLEASKLVHFPDTDTNEVTRPYLVLFHPTRPPWQVRSERGWTSTTGDVLLLLGHVHAWRDDAEGAPDLDIETRDLRVLPHSEFGETDKPVVIRTPSSETHGVGLRAYMEEDRVEILSRVSTRYEKPCRDPTTGARGSGANCKPVR